MRLITLMNRLAPKGGCSIEECEDALATADAGTVVAIADGASAAVFSRIWAELLCRQFVIEPTRRITREW